MSDPLQQASDATKQAASTLSWWQLFFGTTLGAFVLRALLTLLRRFTSWDAQVSAEGRLRDELMKARSEEAKNSAAERAMLLAELAALRKSSAEDQEKADERLREAREALHEAELANIEAERSISALQARLDAGQGVERVVSKPYRSYRSGPKE